MIKHISCAIAGVTGYTGRELLRILLQHPECTVTELYSNSKAGQTFSALYPQFSCWADHELLPIDQLVQSKADILFLALPHGTTAEIVAQIENSGFQGKIIDLSADFRLNDASVYEKTYGQVHRCPQYLNKFTYGLTEFDADEIKKANRLANPGCFATALQMLTYPLVEAGYDKPIAITGLTGSTGSGATPTSTTHHPDRYGNFKAYKVLEHRHMAEANQRLQIFSNPPEILFTPVSAPVARGIWMTATFPDSSMLDLHKIYQQKLSGSPLVRLLNKLPELREAVHTPLTLIGTHQSGNHAVAGIAIDNLLKGAASQAVQNMNLMMGLDEATGLIWPPGV